MGVKKHDLPEATAKKIPQVTQVHVFIEHGKVSLRPYKEASDKVFDCIEDFAPNCDVEKASIDEVYIDVTDLISHEPKRNAPLDTCTFGKLDHSEYDANLQTAASIAHDIRMFIKRTHGFSCSAGISHNKMLAKMASGMNKPHKQTIITWAGVEALLTSMPIRKLPKMGGKLGKNIEGATSAIHVVDLQRYAESELITLFGQKIGSLLHSMCRGIDPTLVEPKGPSKSIISGMSLNPISSVNGVEKIFTHLATDLAERMRIDYYLNKRIATHLVVGIRLGSTPTQKNHTTAMPKRQYSDDPDLEKFGDNMFIKKLVSSGIDVFNTVTTSIKDWNTTRLSLAATNFCILPPTSSLQPFSSPSIANTPTPSVTSPSPDSSTQTCTPKNTSSIPSLSEKRKNIGPTLLGNKRSKGNTAKNTIKPTKMNTLDSFFTKL